MNDTTQDRIGCVPPRRCEVCGRKLLPRENRCPCRVRAEVPQPPQEFRARSGYTLLNMVLAILVFCIGAPMAVLPWLGYPDAHRNWLKSRDDPVAGSTAKKELDSYMAIAAAFTIAGLAVMGGSAALLVKAFRARCFCVLVGPKGLTYREPGRELSVPWEDVTRVWQVKLEKSLKIGAMESRRRLMLGFRDGQTLEIPGFMERVKALRTIIEEETLRRLLPSALEDISNGKSISFGSFSIAGDGIRHRDTVLAWADLEKVQMGWVFLTIRKRGKVLDWLSVPLNEIVNMHLVEPLLRALRERPPTPEQPTLPCEGESSDASSLDAETQSPPAELELQAPAALGGAGRCPSCGKPLLLGVAICVECGFDQRTGETLPEETREKPTGGAWQRLREVALPMAGLSVVIVVMVCLIVFWPRPAREAPEPKPKRAAHLPPGGLFAFPRSEERASPKVRGGYVLDDRGTVSELYVNPRTGETFGEDGIRFQPVPPAAEPESATSPASSDCTTECAKPRTWTDGAEQWQGTFLGIQDGNVCLMKDDGAPAKVPLDRLSKPDQEFVRSTQKAMISVRDPAKLMLWTDHTGHSVILATFLRMDEGKVRLKRVDGREITVAPKWLREADRVLLRTTGRLETGK